jgi:hypothetical protein
MNVAAQTGLHRFAKLICIVLIPGLAACRGQEFAVNEAGLKTDQETPLDLIGYNYTDRHINDYSVNGQGGGPIRVSSRTSGGGGIVCCAPLLLNGNRSVFVRVRWQFGGCLYLMKSTISGQSFEYTHPFYKEVDVEVQRAAGMNPNHLETHFYPDGSIQVFVTEDMSLPRVALDEGRVTKTKFPRCKDGKKPE